MLVLSDCAEVLIFVVSCVAGLVWMRYNTRGSRLPARTLVITNSGGYESKRYH